MYRKTTLVFNKENKQFLIKVFCTVIGSTVADPGFPVGGAWTSYGGLWTPEVATFQKFCMSKQKNLDP